MATATVQDAAPDATLLDAVRLLRTGGGALFAHALLHGRLARVEWQLQQRHLLRLLLIVLAGLACLTSALVFAGAAALAAAWDGDYRVPVAAGMAALFAVGVLTAWRRLQSAAAAAAHAFDGSREELAADAALLRENL